MNEYDRAAEEGTFLTAPVTERPTNHPLTEFVIAAHLGIEEYTADNAEECLRRVKALFELYDELGVPLLYFKDETPFSARLVNRAFIRRHLGQRTGHGSKTGEEFDRGMKLLKARRTGIPSTSYHRVVYRGHIRLAEPCRIYQEIDDLCDTEIRRVEVYPDGRMLWHNDDSGFEPGTATKEWTQGTDIPLLSVRNKAVFQRVDEVPAEEFERLWGTATGVSCKWVVELKAPREWMTLGETDSVYCDSPHTTDDGSAFCAEHREIAARVFPALFETK